ncbi:hypothetical protein ACFUIY_14675 [Streptomyces griseorubiginosus]|uniref:hypothetical protein n=1 Tax=Streptomyces griseorubiginosus TaxID=67304 RepID=UPI003632B025
MSSTFYIVCLSHDPALISTEYSRAELAEAAIKDGTSGHTDCDRMIVRSSGAPVEVGCPGHGFRDDARPRRHWCRSRHAHTQWVDVGWLHVLVHARLADALPESVARHHDLSCWTEQRLWRLREELGLELPSAVDEPGDDQPEVVHAETSAQASAPPEVDESGAGLAEELARLRAGEDPGHEPGTVPTPGQWIWLWNRATAKQRLEIAAAALSDQAAVEKCLFQNHRWKVAQARALRDSLARVEVEIADMEKDTVARHWASMLRAAIAGPGSDQTGDSAEHSIAPGAYPSSVLSTTDVIPQWRQDPDGTWSAPVGEGLLTVPAHTSEVRRAQLLLVCIGVSAGNLTIRPVNTTPTAGDGS